MSSEKNAIAPDEDNIDSQMNIYSVGPNEKQHETVLASQDDSTSFDEKDTHGHVQDVKIAFVEHTTLDVENDVEVVMDKVEALTVAECRKLIEELLEEHTYDYNFSASQKDKLRRLVNGPVDGQSIEEWELVLKKETAINVFYSPYPEVRAVTRPDDDIDMPCETIRAHLLGYLWACIGQFINSLFNSRYPNITLQSSVAQILLYPCGMFLAWALPDWGITVFGKRHSLNPGPWTYKEQMLSTIIVNVGLTSAYVFLGF